MILENKTVYIKNKDIVRKWYLVDAKGQNLGKLASKISAILEGKNKIAFARHQDMGDFVIVINASKVEVSKDKDEKKIYYRHSGYIGGLRSFPFKDMIKKNVRYPIMKAVKGMLPKNRLGSRFLKRLKVYAGENHDHSAQKPEVLTIKLRRRF